MALLNKIIKNPRCSILSRKRRNKQKTLIFKKLTILISGYLGIKCRSRKKILHIGLTSHYCFHERKYYVISGKSRLHNNLNQRYFLIENGFLFDIHTEDLREKSQMSNKIWNKFGRSTVLCTDRVVTKPRKTIDLL